MRVDPELRLEGIIIIIIIIWRYCPEHCSRCECVPASSLSPSLSSISPRRRRVDSAVSTGTTTPRVPRVRITHWTFTPGPGGTRVTPASLSLVVISSLVLYSCLLRNADSAVVLVVFVVAVVGVVGRSLRERTAGFIN